MTNNSCVVLSDRSKLLVPELSYTGNMEQILSQPTINPLELRDKCVDTVTSYVSAGIL